MPDLHTWTGAPTEQEIALMSERMKLFIFPNEAASEAEEKAFRKAVFFQIAHEKSFREQYGDIPEGASSFRIGDFSMSFGEGVNGSGLDRKTMCQAAYSALLRAGLLYRGLPGTVSE